MASSALEHLTSEALKCLAAPTLDTQTLMLCMPRWQGGLMLHRCNFECNREPASRCCGPRRVSCLNASHLQSDYQRAKLSQIHVFQKMLHRSRISLPPTNSAV